MATTVGQVALDIIMGKNTVSGTVKDAMSDVKKTIGDASATASQKVGAIGSACVKTGTAMLGVTTAIVGMGTAGVKAADEIDEALNQYIVTTGKSIKETEKYEEVLKSIHSNNYGEDYYDIADAMAVVNQQMGDLSDKELQRTTESAIALRDTFGYEVSESIRSVDTLMKNFGITSDEAFNLIVQGAQNGLDFSGELLDSINEYSVQFGKAGLNAEAMFSIFSSGAEAGAWNLDKIGDAVKEFSIRAIDGSKTTVEGFEMIGLSADEMAAKFAAGGDSANEVFNTVIQKLGEMDDPLAQNTAGVALFGTMWEDLGPEVVTQLSAITDGVDASKASMEELKEIRYDNLTSQIEGLKRSFTDNVLVPVGEVLIPMLSELVTAITPVIEAFGDMDPEMQKLIVGVLAVVAAIGPMLIIVGKIITAFSTLMPVISAVGGVIAGLNPIVLVVIGVLWALIANWETVCEVASAAGKAIAEGFKIAYAWALEFGGKVIDFVKNNWQGLLLFLVNPIAGAFKLIYDNCEGFRETVNNFISTIVNFVKDNWQGLLLLLVNPFVGGFKLLYDNCEKFRNFVNNFVSGVKETIVNGFNSAVDFIVGLGKSAYNWGKDIIANIVKGIRDCIKNVASAASDVAGTIRSFLHFTVPDVGPLADFDSYMPDMMSQLAGGMTAGLPGVRKAVSAVADEMSGGLQVQPEAPLLKNVKTYAQQNGGGSTHTESRLETMIAAILKWLEEHNPTDGGGDIYIPITLDGRIVDERVYTAQQIRNLRSGGRA